MKRVEAITKAFEAPESVEKVPSRRRVKGSVA
jgi:hypothetical protein